MHRTKYTLSQIDTLITLLQRGLPNAEIHQRTGIPLSTLPRLITNLQEGIKFPNDWAVRFFVS